MAAISVLLMAGDAIAKSPRFTRGLERFARLPNSRFTAVWFTSFVAMLAGLPIVCGWLTLFLVVL